MCRARWQRGKLSQPSANHHKAGSLKFVFVSDSSIGLHIITLPADKMDQGKALGRK